MPRSRIGAYRMRGAGGTLGSTGGRSGVPKVRPPEIITPSGPRGYSPIKNEPHIRTLFEEPTPSTAGEYRRQGAGGTLGEGDETLEMKKKRRRWPSTRADTSQTRKIVAAAEEAVTGSDDRIARNVQKQPSLMSRMRSAERGVANVEREILNRPYAQPKYAEAARAIRKKRNPRDILSALQQRARREAGNLIRSPAGKAVASAAESPTGKAAIGLGKGLLRAVNTAGLLYTAKTLAAPVEEALGMEKRAEEYSSKYYGDEATARETRLRKSPGAQKVLGAMRSNK